MSGICSLFAQKQRDALKAYLVDNNIQTVINYPVALPFLDAYGHQSNRAEDFPVASQHQREILSLPVFPDMTLEQVNYVTDICSQFAFSGMAV